MLTVTFRGVLRRQAVLRVAFALLGVGLVLFGYVYALSAVTVPHTLAEEWSRTEVPQANLAFVELPGGAYLAVAGLLTMFAAAAFIALTITEEHFSNAMTDAVLRAPARSFLLQALPYQAACSNGTANGPTVEDARDDGKSSESRVVGEATGPTR